MPDEEREAEASTATIENKDWKGKEVVCFDMPMPYCFIAQLLLKLQIQVFWAVCGRQCFIVELSVYRSPAKHQTLKSNSEVLQQGTGIYVHSQSSSCEDASYASKQMLFLLFFLKLRTLTKCQIF